MSKKSEKTEDQLHHMRHSMAHILATAMQELYPGVKFGIGPVIENGFYYDFDLGGKSLNPDDLPKIEKKMREVVKANHPFQSREHAVDEALEYFKKQNQPYKAELVEDIKKHGTTVMAEIESGEKSAGNDDKVTTVTFYKIGPFIDLCRGGHLESTGQVGTFKLTKVSSAYWRADEKNPQLQRVYGVAFDSEAELNKYLEQQAEAKKRDHRKLGQELDLFTFSDLVGAGLPLWTPRGTTIRRALQRAVGEMSRKYKVLPVTIPHIAKIELYEKSGHAAKFGDELFKVQSHYKQEFVLKPVNCPHHTQIYASKPRSYRDLPLRYMESTMQYRDEKPGEIGGLTRVRAITLDDGHTFCRVDQIKEEAANIVRIVQEFYSALGMYGDHWVSLSLRDVKTPEKYIGDDADWDTAESMLQEISDELKLNAQRMEGEAALYGPKLDFMFKDALGNERQLATVQIDFATAKRFDLKYTAEDGSEQPPVMLHRAILGSYERFMAILIEHFAGNFPVWLAPEHVRVATVSDDARVLERAQAMVVQLEQADVIVELDDSSESVGKKIRNATLTKVPYTIVVGEKEVGSSQIVPRIRPDLGGDPKSLDFTKFVKQVADEISSRTLKTTLK
jgi:threonyl-tRNA synthetase